MKYLVRLLRLATQSPFTFASTVACACIVAAFWGGNIGGLYPVIEVVLRGQSLPDLLEQDIQESQDKVSRWRDELAALTGTPEASAARHRIEEQMAGAERSIKIRRRLLPHAERWLPRGKPFVTIVALLGVLLVATLAKNVFIVAHAVLASRLVERVTFDLRREFFRHVLRWDQRTLSQHEKSDIAARFMADLPNVANGLQWFLGRLMCEPLKLVACAIGAAAICWQLLLLSVLTVPAIGWLLKSVTHWIREYCKRVVHSQVSMNKVMLEALNCLPAVQAFTMEDAESGRLERAARDCRHQAQLVAFFNVLTKPTTELLGLGVLCMAVLAGAYLALHQETRLFGIPMCSRPLSLSLLFVFFSLLVGMTDPVRKLGDAYASIKQGLVAAERVFGVLDKPPQVVDAREPRTVARPHRLLQFDNVSFGYDPDRLVVKDFRLEIGFGETIGIVGENGCGKSTLVNLLARFYDPVSGHIRLDGVDLRDLELQDLRQRIGLVTQTALLFDRTVSENISYGTAGATEFDIRRAAQQALAHELIERDLKDGYETVVGDMGGWLSGGQRQRIALARALLRDPELLILDEATSQIDVASEQIIVQALRNVIGRRTTLIVTHRHSLLALTDRIVVMDQGQIVDIGPFDALWRRNVFLQHMHESKDFERRAA